MKEALQPLPGVAGVNVDFENRLVHCKVSASDFDTDAAIKVLAGEGYQATIASEIQ